MSTFYAISNPALPPLPFYVTHAASHFVSRPVNRPTGFHNYQIMQCLEGEATFICGDKTYILKPNDIVLFEPLIPHQYFSNQPHTQSWIVHWICFTVQDTTTLHNLITPEGYCVFQNIHSDTINTYFQTILELLESDQQNHHLKISSTLYQLILDLSAHQIRLRSKQLPSHVLDPVIAYMKEYLVEDMSIDLLSEIIDVSPSYLCRKFNQIYKTTPIKYLITLRMLKAQELITHSPHLSIKDICEQCGYHNTAYFCAEFKRTFKMTPTQYRLEFSPQLLST